MKSALRVITSPLLLAFGVIIAAYEGWCVKLLWLWFAVPALGVRPLTLPLAIGLVALLGAASPHFSKDWQRDEDHAREAILYCLVSPLWFLAIGYVIHVWWMA